MSHARTVAHALVDQLLAEGVTRVFCVPGESYLAALNALRDSGIDIVTCRHEAGAANMAEAHAKLTGEVGVCFVTRGPGATHASVGVHTARQDSTPLVLFIGQVALADRGREAFQEIDYRAFFGAIAKWADELDQPDRSVEFVARAFATARQGRPGPVALALPEDVLAATCAAPARPAAKGPRQGLSPTEAEAVERLVGGARRPVLILGGADWGEDRDRAVALTRRLGLPAICSFRRKDLIDNDDPAYCGDLGLGPNPALLQKIRDADLVLALGARLGENPSQGYTLFDPARTRETLIHIHPDPEELNKVWPARLAICARPGAAAAQLAAGPMRADLAARFAGLRATMRADYEAWTRPSSAAAGPVDLARVFAHMGERLPPDAIVCNGAGNYAAFLHRYLRHRAGGRQLAPTSGAMGYGVPAAIAAKLAAPARVVAAVSGDGCFLMTGQELAVAAQRRLAVIFIVIDNASYGTIRMHQERAFPGRVVATDLHNPDFAAYARAFGLEAASVATTAAFAPALEAALAANGPFLIHVRTDVEDIAPGRTIAGLRSAAAR